MDRWNYYYIYFSCLVFLFSFSFPRINMDLKLSSFLFYFPHILSENPCGHCTSYNIINVDTNELWVAIPKNLMLAFHRIKYWLLILQCTWLAALLYAFYLLEMYKFTLGYVLFLFVFDVQDSSYAWKWVRLDQKEHFQSCGRY